MLMERRKMMQEYFRIVENFNIIIKKKGKIKQLQELFNIVKELFNFGTDFT